MDDDFFEQEDETEFSYRQDCSGKYQGEKIVRGIDEFNLYLEDKISQIENADSDFFRTERKKAKTNMGLIFGKYVIPAFIIWRACLFTASHFSDKVEQKTSAEISRGQNKDEYRIYIIHENLPFEVNRNEEFAGKKE